MSIIRQDYGNLADMATQQLLAPIFPTLVATKAVSKDGLFIINNTLYKATANIAQDAQIVVGTNASLASTVSEELTSELNTTNHMLAPIFAAMKAEKALTKNNLFIVNNTLYKATADIAANATIIVGTNAAVASNISEGIGCGLVGFDQSKVVHSFSSSSKSWAATEDCWVIGYIYYEPAMGNSNAWVSVGGLYVTQAFSKSGSTFNSALGVACAPVKKGQTVAVYSDQYTGIKCYAIKK